MTAKEIHELLVGRTIVAVETREDDEVVPDPNYVSLESITLDNGKMVDLCGQGDNVLVGPVMDADVPRSRADSFFAGLLERGFRRVPEPPDTTYPSEWTPGPDSPIKHALDEAGATGVLLGFQLRVPCKCGGIIGHECRDGVHCGTCGKLIEGKEDS